MTFSDKNCGEKKQSIVNQLSVQIQEIQDRASSLNDSRDFHDTETASSSGVLTFPVILQLFQVLLESLAPILARSLTHGTLVACGETVLKTICLQDTDSILLKKCGRKKSYRNVWRTCIYKRRETRSENR